MGAEGTSIKVRPHPLFGGFGPRVALALLAGPTRPKIDLFSENREAQSTRRQLVPSDPVHDRGLVEEGFFPIRGHHGHVEADTCTNRRFP